MRSGAVTTFTHDDILTGAGQRRYYRLTAVKDSEESVPTPSVYPITALDKAVLIKADVAPVVGGEWALSWEPNPRYSSFTIYSRYGGSGEWELRDTTTGTTWTDSENIQENQPVEYRVVVASGSGAGASGYIMVGANVELTESRGRALLVVDETKVEALAPQLAQLKRDLVGDGWTVDQIAVERDDGNYATRFQAADVKALLVAYYNQHPDLKSMILIGHVPVPFSGSSAVDGHESQAFGGSHIGAWAADVYYGDMDGQWGDDVVNTDLEPPDRRPNWIENRNVHDDGKFDEDNVPSDLEVTVGRIDFARARLRSNFQFPETEPGLEEQISGGTSMSDAELEAALIARYLDRVHFGWARSRRRTKRCSMTGLAHTRGSRTKMRGGRPAQSWASRTRTRAIG